MSAHAVYPPSSGDRWLACHGSIDLIASLNLPAGEHTIYTARGTVIHAMSEAVLLDSSVVLLPGSKWSEWDDHLPEHLAEELVTEHMVTQAMSYVKTVLGMVPDDGELRVEYRCTHSDVLFGTADAVITAPGLLIIADLKTGNHLVSPDSNVQLLTYAGMAVSNLQITPDVIMLAIIQPPNEKHLLRVWRTDMQEIHRHMERVEDALEGYKLIAGSHCKWCPAKNQCCAGMEVLDGLELPDIFR